MGRKSSATDQALLKRNSKERSYTRNDTRKKEQNIS